MNSRIVSTACTRAISVPVGRCSKYGRAAAAGGGTPGCEDRVDAVSQCAARGTGAASSMPCAEEHEHHQADGDRDDRALRLVHDHLVDDHLREERRRQTDQLNEEGSEQGHPPDALSWRSSPPEPAEAKAAAAASSPPASAPDSWRTSSAWGSKRSSSAIGQVWRRLAYRLEIEELARVGLDDERRARRLALQECDAGEARLGERAVAGAEAKRLEGFYEFARAEGGAESAAAAMAASNGSRLT